MKTKKFYIIILLIPYFMACEKPDQGISQFQLISMSIGSIQVNLDGSSTNLPVDRNIGLTFSRPIDPSSIEKAVILSESGDEVNFNINLNADNTVINISPIGSLHTNKVYTLSCTNELKGTDGQELEPISIDFKTIIGTIELLKATAGEIDIPDANRVLNVPLTLDLSFNFSEPIDVNTFENAFQLSGSNQTMLNFSYENENTTANVYAINPLTGLAKYDLTISDQLTGEDGQPFNEYNTTIFTAVDSTYKFPEISDAELLTKVQQHTFQYFWEFAHPVSGMIRERNTSGELVTVGGTGFGMMAIVVGIERGFITRESGVERWNKIIEFLTNADRFHGVWPHWMNGSTGVTIPFSENDDGADLVETALLMQGMLTVRQYLNPSDVDELQLIEKINLLWESVEWNWFRKGEEQQLYWHWSPNVGWQQNLPVSGWNESLIVYVLAASSTEYGIEKEVYDEGWARNGEMENGESYYGISLPLGPTFGGPLFFSHYSFLGLDPRELSDQYANYWEQNVNHAMINQQYCTENPNNYAGYGNTSWGLTASDTFNGYNAHSPENDYGTISPTAALSSMPYTPDQSMEALHHFYYLMGDKLWGEYGFYDAFNVTESWYANSYLAIDQGPIIIMIENYRSELLWELFMSSPEIQEGLNKLEFNY